MSTPDVVNLAEYREALKAMRSHWGNGPWVGEPDKAEWTDEKTGYPCLALRNPVLGNWCGYVGVRPGHSCYGDPYDKVDAYAHGGLTYSQRSPGPQDADDALWWFGFDCAHALDLIPFLENSPFKKQIEAAMPRQLREVIKRMPMLRDTYRTLAYVKDQCERLAAQLKALD
jgi:hypothetical protein